MAQRSSTNKSVHTKSLKTTMEWIEMGPSNLGGRTRAILIDKNNPNLIYAGAIAGGLWKSTTAGSSWTKVTDTDKLENIAISTLYQSANGDIYFGTGEYYYVPNNTGIQGGGIWKSTDNGATWNHLSSTNDDAFKFVTKLAGYGSKLYAATNKGLRVSNDGGVSWINPIPSSDPNFEMPATDVEVSSDGSVVVASVNDMAYVCNTGDDIFVLKSDANNIATDVLRINFAISPSNPNHIYCLAVNLDGKLKNIYESIDKGNSWNPIISNVTNQFQPFGLDKNKQGKYTCSIAVSPTDENTIYIGGVDLYRYNPNTSFEQLTASYMPSYSSVYVHRNIFTIDFSPNFATDNTIYVGTDGGIFKSTDAGSSWQSCSKNYNTGFFTSIGFSVNNQVMGGTIYNGLLVNNLNGTTDKDFQQYLGGIIGNVEVSLFNPNCIIVSSAYGNLYRANEGPNSLTIGVSDSIIYGGVSPAQNLGTYKEPFLPPLRLYENFYDTNSVQYVDVIAGKNLHLGDTVFTLNGFGKHLYHIINADDLNGDTAIVKGDTLKIKDTYTSLTALGLNGKVWISWEALNPTKIPPAWYPVTYDQTINKIQTLEFSADGDIIYFADYDSITNTSKVYRLSNIQAARLKHLATYTSSSCVVTRQLLGTFTGKVMGLAVDPQNNNKLLVTIADYINNVNVYYSTNAATTTDDTTSHNFISKQGNLPPGLPVYSAIILWNSCNFVILGTEKGIYITEDITAVNPSWVEQNEGMAKVPVSQIRQQIHPNGWMSIDGIVGNGIQTGVENHGVIYIATMGRGIFRCEDFRGPVSVPENNYIENSTSIHIYPNPAIDNTTVNFEMTQNSDVEISILNLNGQTLTTKKYKHLTKGTQNIELKLNSLNSGIYLISVKTNDGKYIAKLVKK